MADRDELIADLHTVVNEYSKVPTYKEYNDWGSWHGCTLQQEFGSWNNALEAAGYEVNSHHNIGSEKLIADLQEVVKEHNKVPTSLEYSRWGTYHVKPFQEEFGGWNNALKAAGYEVNARHNIPRKEIIYDLRGLVRMFGENVTIEDYNKLGKFSSQTIYGEFDDWNEARKEVGLDPVLEIDIPKERLLRELRKIREDKIAPTGELVNRRGKHDVKTYQRNFGSFWKATVQAGLYPKQKAPLPQQDYANFVKVALDQSRPVDQIIGLLKAFTGLTTGQIGKFSMKWVNYLDSSRDTIVRVPADKTSNRDYWNIKIPTEWHNPVTGKTEETHFEGLLEWYSNNWRDSLLTQAPVVDILKKLKRDAGTNVNTKTDSRLRFSLGTHLAQREAPSWFIRKQVGTKATNWGAWVSDFYLWNYVHHEIEHPDFEPPEIVLDPI